MCKNLNEHNRFQAHSLLLRIFKLKIKFSFYDLPCSFPIKHSVFLSFRSFLFYDFFPCSYHLSLSLARAQIISLPLDLSSLFLFSCRFANRCYSTVFSFSCAHKCLNSWRCHSEREKSVYGMFDWPKFLGANHNLQLRHKGQTETRSAYNGDWIRRKNKRIIRRSEKKRKIQNFTLFQNKNRCWIFGLTIFKLYRISFQTLQSHSTSIDSLSSADFFIVCLQFICR